MGDAAESCPGGEVLEGLALGEASALPWQVHVAGCGRCQQALARIQADNRFLLDFAVDGGLPVSRPVPAAGAVEIPGYQLVGEIHRGGQGVVYQAVQRSTRRRVAIKLMKGGAFATMADRARFDREIEILGGLNHPHIVTVYDAGVVEGCQYFVMDYVEGAALDAALVRPESAQADGQQARGPGPDINSLLATFVKVCEAVHAAHLRGIIHRDLKPSNIRVDADGEPRVLDFGLAKTNVSAGGSDLTHTGQFVGSLPWAAPEQVEGAPGAVDVRTDVYSLGVILFQLLTGRLPFDVDRSLRAVVDDILWRERPRPSAVVARGSRWVDDELDTIVLKCLSKSRERRYQSAGDLARDLRRYLAGDAIEAKRDSAIYLLRKTLQRYRMRVAVVGTFTICLAVLTMVLALLYGHTARLEAETSRSAARLARLLTDSNIEQGRMAAVLGNMAQAEQLLWRELLMQRDPHGDGADRWQAPPGPPAAYWGLWELYRRYPCRWTVPLDPPGVRVTAAADAGVGLWVADLPEGACRFDLRGQVSDRWQPPTLGGGRLIGIADGGALLLESDGQQCRAYRRDEGSAPVFVTPPMGNEHGVEFCAAEKGRLLAGMTTRWAVVWRMEDGATVLRIPAGAAAWAAVALSPDERHLALRDELGQMQIWAIESGQCVGRGRGAPPAAENLHTRGGLLFSSNGRRLADGWMELSGRVWDLTVDPPRYVDLQECPGDGRVLAFSDDGDILAVGDVGGVVWVFDARDGQCRRRFVAHDGRVCGVGFAAAGQGLWSCGERELRFWELADDPGAQTIGIAGEGLHAVAFRPDGRSLFAAGGLGVLHQIDLLTLERRVHAFGNTATVSSVAISPDGRRRAAGAYANAVYLWEAPDHDGAPERIPHPGRVSQVCFSPDGRRLATACDDRVVRVWRLADAVLERSWKMGDRVPSIAYDSTGDRLAIGVRDGALILVQVTEDRRTVLQAAPRKALRAVAFSPDGRWLYAAGADRVVAVWDLATEQEVIRLAGHNQEIFALGVDARGELIATGDTGGTVRLWHASQQRALAALDVHAGAVMAVAFGPDGRTLASVGLDGTVQIQRLDYYAPHIAGNLPSGLRSLPTEAPLAGDGVAWSRWAAEAMRAADERPAMAIGAD